MGRHIAGPFLSSGLPVRGPLFHLPRQVIVVTSAASDVETRRSRVRRWVTYAVIYGYLLLAAIVIVWLMWAERYEVAIGVLGGVAGLAGSISGFWFGSRRPEPSVG